MTSRRARQRYDKRQPLPEFPVTGWEHELMQDTNKDLSYWLSERVDSRMHAREAAEQIKEKR